MSDLDFFVSGSRGFKVNFPVEDEIYKEVRESKTYDNYMFITLNILRDRGIIQGAEPFHFLDVGANVGLFSLGVLGMFPRAQGIAFEPNETT